MCSDSKATGYLHNLLVSLGPRTNGSRTHTKQNNALGLEKLHKFKCDVEGNRHEIVVQNEKSDPRGGGAGVSLTHEEVGEPDTTTIIIAEQ